MQVSTGITASTAQFGSRRTQDGFVKPTGLPPSRLAAAGSSRPPTATNHQQVPGKDKMPPMPKSHVKQSCPSPPAVLKDKKSTVQFTKGKLLGEVLL